jgi:uncharacterized protein (DUF983 family)
MEAKDYSKPINKEFVVKCSKCGKGINTFNKTRKYCYECRLKMLKVWSKKERKNE